MRITYTVLISNFPAQEAYLATAESAMLEKRAQQQSCIYPIRYAKLGIIAVRLVSQFTMQVVNNYTTAIVMNRKMVRKNHDGDGVFYGN